MHYVLSLPECTVYFNFHHACRSTFWTPRILLEFSPSTTSKSINITTNRYWNISFILRSSCDKKFRIKSHLIQDDLSMNDWFYFKGNNLSQEETFKTDGGGYSSKNVTVFPMPCMIKLDIRWVRRLCKLEALQIITIKWTCCREKIGTSFRNFFKTEWTKLFNHS